MQDPERPPPAGLQRFQKVCVVGAGAVGGFLGVSLASGADVALSAVARGRTLAALQGRGWTLQRAGEPIHAPVRAVADPRDLGQQDLVIIAVKAPALPAVAPLLAPLLGPRTVILPALNGVPWWFTAALADAGTLASVDPDGVVAASLPFDAVIGAVVYPSCSSPEPGTSRHHSGSRLVFGEVAGRPAPQSDRLRALVALFRAAGLAAEDSTDIRTEVWAKLLGNACFNPVSLVTGSATDLMIDDPGIHALFETMMSETIAVGRALGIDVATRPAERIALTRKLGHVKTSMLQDVEAGKPVELDAILGAVIELASRSGIRTPANENVYALARMRAMTLGLFPQRTQSAV